MSTMTSHHPNVDPTRCASVILHVQKTLTVTLTWWSWGWLKEQMEIQLCYQINVFHKNREQNRTHYIVPSHCHVQKHNSYFAQQWKIKVCLFLPIGLWPVPSVQENILTPYSSSRLARPDRYLHANHVSAIFGPSPLNLPRSEKLTEWKREEYLDGNSGLPSGDWGWRFWMHSHFLF